VGRAWRIRRADLREYLKGELAFETYLASVGMMFSFEEPVAGTTKRPRLSGVPTSMSLFGSLAASTHTRPTSSWSTARERALRSSVPRSLASRPCWRWTLHLRGAPESPHGPTERIGFHGESKHIAGALTLDPIRAKDNGDAS
jgi:hypothetical protein